ncbi:hypothetical protein [Labrys neptuniae]|uniref:Uncharacterized protein n=1 Tax=Labrys neptuniae TaxID=376174 RepID=A0ABV3PGJ1_9HYPH
MKFRIEVCQTVEVELDEAKFTPAFMEEFRKSFFPFFEIGEHAEHIAQLVARGVIDTSPSYFIEGYGPAKDMGIKAEITGTEIDGWPA